MHGEAWNRLQGMTDALANSGLVVVDKPQGMTSHDVVGRLRRIFHTRKVGHAGTLDPMATGVLVVGLERGTKFLAHMVASTKSYDATIRLGMATHTDDAEGERTGAFESIESDAFTVDAKGNDEISYADYAVGMVALIEVGSNNHKRVDIRH